MRAVQFQRHRHGAQGILASKQIGRLGSLDKYRTLTYAIELDGLAIVSAHHLVLNGHYAALHLNHVDGVGAHIVVPVILLVC